MLVSKNYQYNQCTIRMQRKVTMNSMLHGSSLILSDLHCSDKNGKPCNWWPRLLHGLMEGSFPLWVPFLATDPNTVATCFYRCTTVPVLQGFKVRPRNTAAASLDSKRSRSTHVRRPNSQTNVLKNTPTTTVVQSIINFNNLIKPSQTVSNSANVCNHCNNM